MICENPMNINEITKIPFLPISFFKTKKILSVDKFEKVFYSSGTTTNSRSNFEIECVKNTRDSGAIPVFFAFSLIKISCDFTYHLS